MKIKIANDSSQSLGGGFSFNRNFAKGVLKLKDAEIVQTIDECDVMLIPSATMVLPETFERAKELKKKIVLRIDNMPKKSRNRRSRIYTRIKRYADESDEVIYQSEWARSYVGYYLDVPGVVINNGVDKEIFNEDGRKPLDYKTYLFSQFNRDETKQMHKAFYYFFERSKLNSDAEMHLVGQFSPELIESGFDFFCNERVDYHGVVSEPIVMAQILKNVSCFIYSYFNDACSNSLLEAMACGCRIIWLEETGGAKELKEKHEKGLAPISIKEMAREYVNKFNGIL